MLITLTIVLLIIFLPLVWIFNLLIRDRNRVLAAWSDIDVQLKRRHNLIPQLVTTVKAYADFEKTTLTLVTRLRSESEATEHLPAKAAVESAMHSAINKLMVVVEAYPELKSSNNFQQLQTDLIDIEDHLQYARRFYNGAVRIFNTRIASFPHLIVARLCGFKPAEFFEVSDNSERLAPTVELNK